MIILGEGARETVDWSRSPWKSARRTIAVESLPFASAMCGEEMVDRKPAEVARAEEALGKVARAWRPVKSRIGNDRGRWLLQLSDRSSVFVKAAYDEASTGWLQTEALVYQGVEADFIPRLLAWDGHILVLEDLSEAEWPPPWTPESVTAVRAGIEDFGRVHPPEGLPPLQDLRGLLVDSGWAEVERDPRPFLSLGVCTAEWLEGALPVLRGAAERVDLAGDALVHVDIRSDNLCLRDGRALFVDWNWAAIGNPMFDLAEWLPSLAAEGGPYPEETLAGPVGAPFAAALAGLWCARIALPPPPGVPRLRELQRMQAMPALDWAVRALDLPPRTAQVSNPFQASAFGS